MDSNERGAALPLVALALALMLSSVWIIAGVAERAVDRAQAQSAADAAALAGVADGEGAARRVAGSNDATLVSFAQEGNEVVVTVVHDGVRAIARAERVLRPPD